MRDHAAFVSLSSLMSIARLALGWWRVVIIEYVRTSAAPGNRWIGSGL